uniref:Glyoxylate/hydroxypyruvate reduct n=1 Tax=Glossina morsitans morsitans TaxID=37546 RepID=A0A1B0FID3_GLOMM
MLAIGIIDKIDNEVITRGGPQLKCIATFSVGYEPIDLEACKKLGIRVTRCPNGCYCGINYDSIVGRLFETDKDVYSGGWKSWSPNYMCGQGLNSCQVGLIGFGRIRQHQEAAEKVRACFLTFEEMVSESDVIIVCCSLTPSTQGIFDECAFSKMKRNCIFINTARGSIVDQQALYETLKEKRIMAAELDVTIPELLPLGDSLLKLNNIVILPHIGSADIEARIQMSHMTALNILAALKDENMIAEVPLYIFDA